MDQSPRQDSPYHRRTVRATVILVIACVISAAAGVLTYLASHSIPQALLAAGSAASGSTGFLHQISDSGSPDGSHPGQRHEPDAPADYRESQ